MTRCPGCHGRMRFDSVVCSKCYVHGGAQGAESLGTWARWSKALHERDERIEARKRRRKKP